MTDAGQIVSYASVAGTSHRRLHRSPATGAKMARRSYWLVALATAFLSLLCQARSLNARDPREKAPRVASPRSGTVRWVLKSSTVSRPVRTAAPVGRSARPSLGFLASLQHVRVVTESMKLTGLDWGLAGGHLIVLERDGSLTIVPTRELNGVYTLNTPFQPMSADEVRQQLQRELPWRFRWTKTGPWLVGSTADRDSTRRLCRLLKRHYAAYCRFASRRGLPLARPPFPLVLLLFDKREDFESYARMDGIRDIAPEFAGYYSLESNRVAFSLKAENDWHNLSTLFHEATHQLVYNTGFLKRYAAYPKWLLEGLAMYFESPAIAANGTGTGQPAFNYRRWETFQKHRADRTEGQIVLLLASDEPFKEGANVLQAYSEAWALTYYLAERRPRQFQKYLKKMVERKVLQGYSEEERLRDFALCFGTNIEQLDRDMCRFMDRLGRDAARAARPLQ